ncbi:MAG: tetratricopeptide repeat protein [Candidatus Sumerlaeota bacterium]|nr:tetratricopeptide repeat protein [Candidatus Sumerlaeota bacterium]
MFRLLFIASLGLVLLGAGAPQAGARWFPWFGDGEEGQSMPKNMEKRYEMWGFEPEGIITEKDKKKPEAKELAINNTRSHYMTGAWLMAKGSPAEALKFFNDALQSDPDSMTIQSSIAEAYLALDRVDDAIEKCKVILQKDPKVVEAYLTLGKAYEKRGQADKAIESYRKGLESYPESLSLLEPLGNLYLRQQNNIQSNMQGVIEIFKRWHDQLRKGQRRNLYVMAVLAQFYKIDNQIDKAAAMYREAIQVYPDHMDLYVSLSEMLLKEGRRDEVLGVVKQGMIRNPFEPRLQALFERCAGSRKVAIEAYRKFADDYDQLCEIQLMWGQRSWQALRDYESAEIAFKRVLEFDANNRDALLGLSQILQLQSRWNDAKEYLRRLAAAWPDQTDAYKGLAAVQAQSGHWTEAADEYEAVIKIAPDDFDAYLKLALLREQSSQGLRATPFLEKALQRFTEPARQSAIYERMGSIYLEAGQTEEGIKALRKALEGRPKDPAIHVRLIKASLKAGKNPQDINELIAQARKAFGEKAYEFDELLAEIYQQNGMPDAAIESLRRAIESKPDLFDLRQQLIVQLILAKKHPEAEAAIKQAQERFGDKEKWKLTIAWADLYMEQDRYDEALRMLEPRVKEIKEGGAVDLSVKLPVFQAYAIALNKAKRRDDAIAIANEILKEAGKPDREEAREIVLRTCGYLFCDLKAWDKAKEIFDQLLTVSTTNDDYHYQMGAIYTEMKDGAKAESSFRRAIELNPRNFNAMNALGYLYADEGRNLTEAVDLIRKAMEFRPKAGYIIDSLGWAYFKKGELDQALKYLKEATSLPPVDAEIYDHLGDVYRKRGEIDLALKSWEEALKMQTDRPGLRDKIEKAKQEKIK